MQTRYSWTQACCLACFEDRHPGWIPTRLREPYRKKETCVYCGQPTKEGLYIRIDPKEAPHPTRVKD